MLLGENGVGKTTFIKMLAGALAPDAGATPPPKLHVSYKPQKIAPRFGGRVADYLQRHISEAVSHARFVADVLEPLRVDALMETEVPHLSQRYARYARCVRYVRYVRCIRYRCLIYRRASFSVTNVTYVTLATRDTRDTRYIRHIRFIRFIRYRWLISPGASCSASRSWRRWARRPTSTSSTSPPRTSIRSSAS